ncbi:MAG: glucosyltransferase domain-containing protein [Lachnospiraceae bacterium]|nr:glucosyltransferase domain-containing protein [Lachnospiraceae bacterium]
MDNKVENVIPQFLNNLKKQYKYAFFSGMICGLTAHLYHFTNKFFNYDELYHTPEGTGEGLALGRWGLYITGQILKHFFGNYSFPLVNGLIALIIMIFAACTVIRAFEVKNVIYASVIGGLFAVFPSVTCNYFYMYTSPYYSLAMLLSCISALLITEKVSILRCICSILLLSFSTGIYQSYFPVAVCILLGVLILNCQNLINDKDSLDTDISIVIILKRGCVYIGCLLASLIMYLIMNKAALKIFNVTLMDYQGISSMGKIDPVYIIKKSLQSYSHFFHLFTEDVYKLNPTSVLKICALLLFILSLMSVTATIIKKTDSNNTRSIKNITYIKIIYIILLSVYPIALFLLFSMIPPETSISAGMLNSTVFAFVLPLCILEQYDNKSDFFSKKTINIIAGWTAAISGTMIIFVYIWYANGNYQSLQYTNYHDIAYYQTIMTQIKSVEGYSDELPVIILGSKISDTTNSAGGLVGDRFALGGKAETNISAYSSNNLFTKYLGFTPEFLWSDEDQLKYANDPTVIKMPCYPKEGAVKIIDGAIVVKLQEKEDWLVDTN